MGTQSAQTLHIRSTWGRFASALLLAAGSVGGPLSGLGTASAQTLPPGVYKIVSPNGRVTYSDVPPFAPGGYSAGGGDAAAASVDTGALPTALRQVVQRYPVVLYTSANCGPCNEARSFLQRRGVPYSEKSVNSNDDIDALKRVSGDTTLPFATLGKQFLKGFSSNDWGQYLNVAGYPDSSQLPPNYRFATATPLVVKPKPQPGAVPVPGADDAATAAAAPQPAAADNRNANPAGIRF